MSADLHIHVFEGITEDDLAQFKSTCLGSKYYGSRPYIRDYEKAYGEGSAHQRVSDTPSTWVGEVSWLKAAIFEDGDAFVPDPIGAISEAIGEELPVIDDALIEKIRSAMSLDNKTSYSIASTDEVIGFLEKHRGKSVFTVSW